MLNIIKGIVLESVKLFNQMSPYLLFGFLFAGILHIFVSVDSIAKHLGKSSVGSVVKAVVLGIPLPLCSCGVIPAAIALEKKGASKGSVVSFLIATPITGVDSIFATFSLLGLFFAVFRVLASAITAFIAGVLTNIFSSGDTSADKGIVKKELFETCDHCQHGDEKHEHGSRSKVKELFHYAFVELLGDIWKWLLVGILLAGVISYLIPEQFIQKYLGQGWLSMLVMLVVGIPMYVCSTGSIPIAASLMFKGMSPGAALVFLLAGPATNAVTVTVVARELGKKVTFFYVGTIALMSILFGLLLNYIWALLHMVSPSVLAPMKMLPNEVKLGSSIILSVLIILAIFRQIINKGRMSS